VYLLLIWPFHLKLFQHQLCSKFLNHAHVFSCKGIQNFLLVIKSKPRKQKWYQYLQKKKDIFSSNMGWLSISKLLLVTIARTMISFASSCFFFSMLHICRKISKVTSSFVTLQPHLRRNKLTTREHMLELREILFKASLVRQQSMS